MSVISDPELDALAKDITELAQRYLCRPGIPPNALTAAARKLDGVTQTLRDVSAELTALTNDADERPPVVFTWHSSSITEDGSTLIILFEGCDGHDWALSIELGRDLEGAPASFGRAN